MKYFMKRCFLFRKYNECTTLCSASKVFAIGNTMRKKLYHETCIDYMFLVICRAYDVFAIGYITSTHLCRACDVRAFRITTSMYGV